MKRRSRCEWMPMLPRPIWPLAGHARLGQNTVVGSMTILLSWLCWGACQEEVCLDPRCLCNLTPPRFSGELPSRLLQPSTIVLMKISQRWMRLTDNFAQFRVWYNAGKARDFLSASRRRGGVQARWQNENGNHYQVYSSRTTSL